MPWSDYFERFLEKDRLATGKLINILENGDDPQARREILRACARQNREAYIVGVTGVPGAGKSTLIDQLGCWLLDRGQTVGVVCVDPSSPFRGGAILGDRIRFVNLSKRKGCFIRSMATRGHLGGLGAATADVVRLLEAGGYDVVIVETVGIGQTEVEIVGTADTVVLVTVPGLGDQIQISKAGIMEIGDIFVVNQSDRPGAEETAQSLRNDLAMFCTSSWLPPVIQTIAPSREGVDELGEALLARKAHLIQEGTKAELQRKRRLQSWDNLMMETFTSLLKDFCENHPYGKELKKRVEKGDLDIYEASSKVWQEVMKSFFDYDVRVS
ncbi:MAG: methylmalonyl Co-A mutase-associated GTPase MeaB [Deferrisomatales bacterium]